VQLRAAFCLDWFTALSSIHPMKGLTVSDCGRDVIGLHISQYLIKTTIFKGFVWFTQNGNWKPTNLRADWKPDNQLRNGFINLKEACI